MYEEVYEPSSRFVLPVSLCTNLKNNCISQMVRQIAIKVNVWIKQIRIRFQF
jgi:hypothetical protein